MARLRNLSRWWLLGLATAVLAGAGGYLVGSSAGADEHEAAAARQSALRAAFADARSASFTKGLNSGFGEGEKAGQRQGNEEGSAQGAADGVVAVRAQRNRLRRTRITASRATGSASRGAPSTPAPTATLDGDGGVLVVGDSLEVLTSPYLKKYIPAGKLTVNAVGGYSSLQIFDLFKESYDPSQSVIVFDAGTNDNPAYPSILAGRLQAVADIVGNRCMVVPTIHGLSVNGIDSSGKNKVVREFAASRPATVTPDWAGFVGSHPELMQPDNLHPIAEGADARAQLIAQGVDECEAIGGGL